MNRTTLLSLHSLALAALVTGCAARPESVPPVAPPVEPARPHAQAQAAPAVPAADNAHREREIRAVLEMQQRGELTDKQALRLIARLNGITPTQDGASGPSGAAPAAVAVVAAVAPAAAPVSAVSAPHAGAYKPAAVMTGRLRSIGSDSMDRVMERWTKGFSKFHPALRAGHEGKGSSTAVPALLEGRADFGPMSRPLKAEEIARFEARYGYAPTQIRTAVDALAVYVHPTNPLAGKSLTLRQVDAAFSASRKRGGSDVVTWGDLGATGEWKAAPVRLYSRNSASGTYGFFRDEVLLKGDFREGTRFEAGSAEVVAAVASDKFGIGYSGIGYKTAAVAAVAIAADETKPAVSPDEKSAVSGSYPIARSLSVVINRKPGETASDLQREFVTYILSGEGQSDVAAEGYFAIPEAERGAELNKLRYNAE